MLTPHTARGGAHFAVSGSAGRTLRQDIERALRDHPMSKSRFGRRATNDPRLVDDVRAGRQPGPRVAARVRAFIASIAGEVCHGE